MDGGGFNNFPKGISLKVNAPVYLDDAVQYVSHYAMKTPPVKQLVNNTRFYQGKKRDSSLSLTRS